MRIALVSPYDWAVPGGVNRHVTHLARQFLRMGHQVRIFAPSSRRWAHQCEHLTVIGERIVGLPASGSVANVCLSFNLGLRVKSILAHQDFDVIHLHEPFMPLLPFQFIRYTQTTTIATFHATREGGNRLYAYSQHLLKPWWHRLHGRIAVSRAALRMIGRYFAGRYRIIPNGVDYELFAAPAPPLPRLRDHRPNVLFVGRQERRKGLPYLLEAYAILKREMPDIRLIIVGPDGGMRAACQRYIQRKQLQDVVFTDYVPDRELPRYYKSCDVFCAPNTGQESFGIILLEAMAAGAPIVASRIEGFTEVLTHGREGLLVPPRDSEALAKAIARLLTDPQLREELGARGAKTAERYSWDRIAQQVLDYYLEVDSARLQGEPR